MADFVATETGACCEIVGPVADDPSILGLGVGAGVRKGDDALREACPVRLRPVLMTSLTVILALLPAALGLGAGADTNGPMAIAVIGGMVSSTLLTLVVVPAVYSLVEQGLRRLRGRLA